MKNISIKTVLVALLFLAGCGKDYLEPDNNLVLTVSEYYATLNKSAVEGITANMYGGAWFNMLDKATSCLEGYCGNAQSGDPVYNAFFNGTLNSAYQQLGFLWSTNYTIIKNVNQSLNGFVTSLKEGGKFKENYDADPQLQAAVNTCIGELRFFRAIAYFNLVKWFGPVPLVYDNIKQMAIPASWQPVVEEDIYDFIIRDMNDAIEKLPATRNGSSTNKLSQISAKALLAKVYLTKAGMSFGTAADFSQAATLANGVITNPSGYALTPTYHENFLPKYKVDNFPVECLWGWKWSWTAAWASFGTQNSLQSYLASSHFTQSWDGWSSVLPSVDLRESYEPGDLRRYSSIMENGDKYPEFWIAYVFPGQTTPGYVYFDGSILGGKPSPTGMHIRKHLAGRDFSTDGHIAEMHTDVYTPIIRLADLYLTYAEAILGKSASTSDAKALQYFNTIRERAGLPDKTSITYADIWNERRHEFAFEFCNTDDLFRYNHLYPAVVKTMLLNQKRGTYTCVTAPFMIDGVAQSFPAGKPLKVITSKTYVDFKLPAVNDDYFRFPYPLGEINVNTYINEPPMRFDFVNYQ
ncbi:MAG: RagB/SusD family nutrient uptake outer membrane protein [Bacteroidales bacterium]|nr:RagB/SusD family nutrient uptake outer membrane protein [Bacteroidales bacterium]